MNDVKKRIDVMVSDIKQERDALQVKLQLAKLDAGDEWKKLEAKARELGNATADASKDIGAAAKLLGEEIRDGFKKIARHF